MIEYISKVSIGKHMSGKRRHLGMCAVCGKECHVIYRRNFLGNKEPTARGTEIGIMHESCYQDRGKNLIERFRRKQHVRTRLMGGFDTGFLKVKLSENGRIIT